jgi:hypothetical protein
MAITMWAAGEKQKGASLYKLIPLKIITPAPKICVVPREKKEGEGNSLRAPLLPVKTALSIREKGEK